jgi:hypothetical protein
VKAKGEEWFQYSEDFAGSLDIAFRLWDAVSEQLPTRRLSLISNGPGAYSLLSGLYRHTKYRKGIQGH